MNKHVLLTAMLSITGPLSFNQVAQAQTYSLTEIGTFRSGSYSIGTALNEAGEVTGYANLSQPPARVHAFLYSHGRMRDLGTLDGYRSHGTAINARGEVTGWAENGMLIGHAFLYSHGQMRDLGTLTGKAASSSSGAAINDAGEVTGTSDTLGPGMHAFLYSHHMMQDLGTLGGASSQGVAINDAGQVTGDSETKKLGPFGELSSHAFLYTHGSMQDLGTLAPPPAGSPDTSSFTTAINNAGKVTGYSILFGYELTHAFLYSHGTILDLSLCSCRNSYGYAINAVGDVAGQAEIVGTGPNGYPNPHAFLYRRNQFFDLGVLGGSADSVSKGTAINNSAEVVGSSYFNNGSQHAFLYTNHTMLDLNNLIDADSSIKRYVTLTDGIAITDTGFILAQGTNSRTGITSAYLLRECRRHDDSRSYEDGHGHNGGYNSCKHDLRE